MKDVRVATIAKNRLEELRISLTEFRGHDLVDIRVFALPYAGRGRGKEMVATKKGLALNVAKLSALIAALQTAERQAQEVRQLSKVLGKRRRRRDMKPC